MNILDFIKLTEYAEIYRSGYKRAKPFPSVVIDNFFDDDVFEHVHNSFPLLGSSIWKTPSNRHTKEKSVVKRGNTGLKENNLSEKSKNIIYQLNSATFINFLENITGIEGLCPDPYIYEGGYHLSKGQGKLDIHADYSHHDKLGLERRVNVLIYLNKDWDEKFGGSLGLYDKKINLIKKISPIANRMVIFSTDIDSYHGFPDEMNISKEYENLHQGRKSIAMYYYTIPTKRKKHKIIFANDPSFTFEPTIE